ncbi:MAG: tautomerase family protein [Alphaproteobacteria bacterium]|nr:tautomerase family protein [Alphaproteobacteria bacterium]
MPVAKVYVPQGALSADQARAIIKGVHTAIVEVEKRPANAPTYVLIQEIPCEHWGNSGNVYAGKT